MDHQYGCHSEILAVYVQGVLYEFQNVNDEDELLENQAPLPSHKLNDQFLTHVGFGVVKFTLSQTTCGLTSAVRLQEIASLLHDELQPSQLVVFPSSHCSFESCTLSQQICLLATLTFIEHVIFGHQYG